MVLNARQSGLHAGARIQITGDPMLRTEVDATGTAYGVQLSDTRYMDWLYFNIHSATAANLRVQNVQNGTVIRGNRLHGAGGKGLRGSGEFTFAYNVVDSNTAEGVFVEQHGTRATIHNNVLYGNNADGVSVHTTGDVRANVWNNIIDANGLKALRRGTNGQVADGYNCIRGAIVGAWQQTGNVTADPLFVAPASADFRLRADSPCIDAGLDLNQASDIAGNPVIDMPEVQNTGSAGQYLRTWLDIGAHEQQLPCCQGGGGCHGAVRR
jgi:hypothetical protein